MAPPDEAMARPVGRPAALQASVAPACVSVAVGVRVVMADPVTLDRLAGAVTVTVLTMLQRNVSESE